MEAEEVAPVLGAGPLIALAASSGASSMRPKVRNGWKAEL
jgi:hypothetical protein